MIATFIDDEERVEGDVEDSKTTEDTKVGQFLRKTYICEISWYSGLLWFYNEMTRPHYMTIDN